MMDVKDTMIWRDDHGLDGSYEATVDAMAAGADHMRKAHKESGHPEIARSPSALDRLAAVAERIRVGLR